MQPPRPTSGQGQELPFAGIARRDQQQDGPSVWTPTVDEFEDGDGDKRLRQPLTSQRRCSSEDEPRKDQPSRTLMGHQDDASEPFEKSGLPPKPLQPLTSGQICLLMLELLLVGAALIGVSKGVQVIVHGSITQESTFLSIPSIVEDCGGHSVPSIERIFYINLQFARNLSFSQAKLLDLAWDTLVGQGGRFLHGWILYHVLARAIGWMMEYSAVPYDFQLSTLFSTVSLDALWSSMLLVSKKQPRRMTISAVWLSLAILYTLSFPSLWSAATGYLQPSAVAYKMPDSSYATKDSDALSLCWSVHDSRLNGTLPDVVLGPRFSSCYSSFAYLGTGARCSFTNGTSDTWKSLYLYALTKFTIQDFYRITSSWDPLPANDTVNFSDLEPEESRNRDAVWGAAVHGTYMDPQGLYREFTGVEFTFDGNVSNSTRWSTLGGMTTPVPFTDATFQLDLSVPLNGSGRRLLEPVPYNSTLRADNKTGMPLDAPFLSLSHGCGSWMLEMGTYLDFCVCYRGTPLTSDFRTDDALTCISEDGYVWGFAGVVTLIGIILEMCWMVGCFGMWLDVHLNSSLFRMNRPTSGTVRNILDIAGAVRRDLGGDTGAYTDGELRKALEQGAPVGYEVQTGDGKVDRIGVVSVAGPRRRRSGLRLVPGRLYA